MTACLSKRPTMSIGLDSLDQLRGQFDLGVSAACICAAAGNMDTHAGQPRELTLEPAGEIRREQFRRDGDDEQSGAGRFGDASERRRVERPVRSGKPAARTSTISAIFAPRDPPNVSSAPFMAA